MSENENHEPCEMGAFCLGPATEPGYQCLCAQLRARNNVLLANAVVAEPNASCASYRDHDRAQFGEMTVGELAVRSLYDLYLEQGKSPLAAFEDALLAAVGEPPRHVPGR